MFLFFPFIFIWCDDFFSFMYSFGKPSTSLLSSVSRIEWNLGRSTYRRTNCRIQRSLLTIRQGWWWYNHHKRVGHSHAITGSKSNRSRTPGYDQWSRCWWWVEQFNFFLFDLTFTRVRYLSCIKFGNFTYNVCRP